MALYFTPILKIAFFSVSYSRINVKCVTTAPKEGSYVTIGNPVFCLFLYLTGVHFRGKLQHGDDAVIKKSSVDQSELEK